MIMKRLNYYLGYCIMLALLLSGCSKEESAAGLDPDTSNDLIEVSFSTKLNDILNDNRSHLVSDLPACSDAAPAMAHVVIRPEGGAENGDNDITVNVAIKGNAQSGYFTAYSENLKLPAGHHTLMQFMVYSDLGMTDLIWIAPVDDGAGPGTLSEYVENPLPMEFDLFDGEKYYLDVEVLCFDERNVNEYGYQFFDLIPEKAIPFCLYLNYCTDDGRHYVGLYKVDVWRWENNAKGAQLYDDHMNSLETPAEGRTASAPLCFILPDDSGTDNDVEEEFYFEVTLSEGSPGYTGPDKLIYTAVISVSEIKARFNVDGNGIEDGTMEYLHLQYNCGITPPPPFEEPGDNALRYKACLKALSSTSNAGGWAYFSVKNNVLSSVVIAANLEAGATYHQHVHANADCDPYGAVILPLDYSDNSWPTALPGGFLNYSRDFSNYNGTLKSILYPIEDRTVVLHKSDNTPLLCGELMEY